MRNIPEYVSLLLVLQGREPVCIRTGSADLGLFFFAIFVSFSRSPFEKKSTNSQFDLFCPFRSPPLCLLLSFPFLCFLGSRLWRGVPSFSFVRLIPRGSKKEADGRDRWHPVPLFRGKLVEEVAFKIPSPVLVPSVLFPPFEPSLPLKL